MRRPATAAVAVALALALTPDARSTPPHRPQEPVATSHQPCGSWGSYGRTPARTFDYECPSAISPTTARSLVPAWTYKTAKTVTASPVVVDGRVFVGGSGPTMHAVDAMTGDEVWSTYVGSAARPDEHPADEETQFESSPLVSGGIVYAGLDVHNRTVEENHGVRGGVLAFDLATGAVLGWFDVEHDHVDDRTGARLSGCSSVWSSPTLDVDTATLYLATGNCPHDIPEGSDWGRHVEAVSAIDADPRTWSQPARAVRWTFTPDPLNRDDTDFGATANLFRDATGRQLLGIGKKDAVYYALDPATGERRWSTRVTEPGNVDRDFAVGGFIGSTATGRGAVFGATAIGFSPPYFHALDGRTGEVRWSGVAGPSYAASAHVNGVVLAGALDDVLKVWDGRTGELLAAHPLLGPISSGPAIAGDRVYVGSGTSSSDLCAKDAPGSDACLTAFEQVVGGTGGVHAFALAAPGHRAATPGSGGGVLLATEGGRLWAYDAGTLERRVLVRSTADGGTAGAPGFHDVDGPVCADGRGSGLVVTGGGVFRIAGTSLDELGAVRVGDAGMARGCGFLADGRLVTAAADGLHLWFPPLDRTGIDRCVIDADLDDGAGVHVDEHDRIVVAAGSSGVVRYSGPLPGSVGGCTGGAGGGAPAVPPGSVRREQLVAPGPTAPAPSAVTGAGDGGLYVASAASGTIAEIDGSGAFVRFVLQPAGVPGLSTGTPSGLAVGGDGTLYYADAGLVAGRPVAGNGTVRRIRFDAAGRPEAPETLGAGFDHPAGVGLVPSGARAGARPAPPARGSLPATGAPVPVGAAMAVVVLALALRCALGRVTRSGRAGR